MVLRSGECHNGHQARTLESNPDPDAAAVQELAQRLMRHSYPGGPTSVQLFVGRLPDSIGMDIPNPPDARLLGSVLHARHAGPSSMEAVFDARARAHEVVAGYQRELLAGGWTVFDAFGHRPGGFTPGEMGEGNAYRRGGQGPLLMVAAIDREAAATELRIRLDWEMIRHLPEMQRHGVPAGQERMPSLHPPAGVELRDGGGGGGGGNWHSDASVKTSMPVAELGSHFAAQLERAGWKKIAGSADEVIGWSSWSLPGDGDWRGLLLVLAAFSQEERLLSLRIEARDDDNGGWRASGVLLARS